MNETWTKFLPAFLRAKLAGRPELQKIVSNTGWQWADNIVRLGVGLVVGIWVARYLGPERFGLLNYALALVTLFSAFAGLGLDDIIVRDVVRDPDGRNETLGTALFLRLAAGAFTLAAAIGTVFVLRPGDGLSQWLVGIIAVGLVLQAFKIIEYWFHSQVEAKYAVFANNAAFFVCTLLKVVLILAAAPVIAFAWVALVEVAVVAVGLVIAYRSKGHRLGNWRGSLERAAGLLRDGWPLMLSSMVIVVYLRIDQVMLGEMTGNEEVGIYTVAVRLSEVWFFIPSALYWSIFPGIIAARSVGEEQFYERLQRLYNLMALLAYALAVPVTLLAHWLVPALFGEAYARGALMLAVLVWSNLFTSLEMARSGFLTAMNWTRLYLLTVMLGCLVNVALNYWLIPLYGGMGAALASLVAYWLAAHGSCFLFKPLYRTGRMLTKAMVYPKVW